MAEIIDRVLTQFYEDRGMLQGVNIARRKAKKMLKGLPFRAVDFSYFYNHCGKKCQFRNKEDIKRNAEIYKKFRDTIIKNGCKNDREI